MQCGEELRTMRGRQVQAASACENLMILIFMAVLLSGDVQECCFSEVDVALVYTSLTYFGIAWSSAM